MLCTTLFLFCEPKIEQAILATLSRITVGTERVVTAMYGYELFPTSVRDIALGISMMGSEIGEAVAPYFAQYVAKVNHPAAVMRFVHAGTIHILAYYSKTTENHNLCSIQKFLRVLSSLQWCLFETSRINIIEVRRFCTSMY